MDIMDSMWNDHGMDMEWLIPYGFHMDSTWIPQIPYGIWAYPPWIPWTSPHGFHGTIPYGFCGNSMEQGSISMGSTIVKNNVTIEN
jgi:hypothetical protein